ncbi:threonine synthase [Natronospirillum operosum]|uniref:Threonine synthase n=1 Tax=Natronospirillum operosum TaxID=2759953 RepID=A0A4Z0WK87_9GAMM|nr:threonine synthase [Natronospirillum operosum]TGG95861.1 threonine synthase [Natronospirillum operosum]
MKYISTRGQAPALEFEEVLLTGLAPDGGLYVPETLPFHAPEEIRAWRDLPYDELAFRILQPFVAGFIDDDAFRTMLADTYAAFDHKAIVPLQQIDHNEYVLELFHGPTLAFKDFALQLLGRLLDHALEKRGEKAVIMGATSGDTGSAAIEGCRRCANIDIFILHPHQRVSEVQRRQMTTVLNDNIHNIALEGNFDDCQRMVKESFRDQSFLRGERRLVAVNSINWARIMAQIVYYFYSALNLGGPDRKLAFSVPTGNFGDIFAGYLAHRMGLPISQLIVATNRNDVLHRILSQNHYEQRPLAHTLSPSMDIVVSSNFERLLFDLYDRDGAAIAGLMDEMNHGKATLDRDALARARTLFDSHSVDDDATCATIREVFEQTGYLLDPHTAIGVKAARTVRRHQDQPMITLGTAHPVKFSEAVEKAGMAYPELPYHLSDLHDREERYTVLSNDRAQVQSFMVREIFGSA